MFVDVFAKSSPMKLEDFQNFVGFSEYNNLKKNLVVPRDHLWLRKHIFSNKKRQKLAFSDPPLSLLVLT